MDETPFYRKPWFYIVGWLALLVVFYGWQVYRMGGAQATILYVFLDLACIFPALLFMWVAFFAQFVLPVRTAEDRQKIVERLLSYLSGFHGPALFIENGVVREHAGERLKNGPGVVWLDSASAAVTRTATKIKQTFGPGVHFFDKGESIARTVDLHIQTQALGPRESDRPFDPQNGMDESEYQQVQDRRKQVSAWTRDGIEVVPNLSVTFRLATGFPKGNEPGSRFGYRTGNTKRARENEARDKEAIQKAILGEGINPNISSDSPRHRVAWNQIPALLVVDVWREYVSKYTLDELFKPDQEVPPAPPVIPQPEEEEIDLLSQPIRVGASQNRVEDSLTAILREVNKLMDKAIKWFDGKDQADVKKPAETKPMPAPALTPPSPAKTPPAKKTAIQVINDMVKARLTQPEVDFLDDHGKRVPGKTIPSPEYKLLQSRGLEVRGASISTLRFPPIIEEAVIKRWSATWFNNARDESKQIERRRQIITTAGQEKAISKYAEKLSADLLRKQPKGVPNTLKTLVTRTRNIILEDEPLRQKMTTDDQNLFESFEEIIKWMEVNGK
jgi:hypothetical protein